MANTPAVPQTRTCKLGRRCHVSGRGIKIFGTTFQQPLVEELASSSVALVANGSPFASGTLISPDVVLCAAHTLDTVSATDLEILMASECNDNSAPPGMFYQYTSGDPAKNAKGKAKWRTCTLLGSQPQARAVKVIAKGGSTGLDYAFLGIEWKNMESGATSSIRLVTLPRLPVRPTASKSFSKEVLLIGNPWFTKEKSEPAQASAGILREEQGPNSLTGHGDEYGYANLAALSGFSGGGVYNEAGKIIGVLKGSKPGHGMCFLNLGRAAEKLVNQSTLTQWVEQGTIPRHDPSLDIVFKTP